MLFPTLRKSKISSKLSYPVGAERISSELANVPQAPELDIRFYSGQNYFLENRGDPYPILTVWYQGTREGFLSDEPGWHIQVRPIPRTLKRDVSDALKTEFFPQIRVWLTKHAFLSARYGRHSLSVVFDEKSETMLKLEEHHPSGEALSN